MLNTTSARFHFHLNCYNLKNRIESANDGEEALAILSAAKTDWGRLNSFIVLLDWNMPKMNGLEFLIELRADEQLKRTIVFVLTTSRADADRLAAYNHQVAGFIVKQQDGQDFSKVSRLVESYCEVVTF